MHPHPTTDPDARLSERETPLLTLVYRRRRGGDVWHYHPKCSHWPDKSYNEQRETPYGYRFCTECDGHTAVGYVSQGRIIESRGHAAS